VSACEGHTSSFGSIKWDKLAEAQFAGRSKIRLQQIWGWYKKLVSAVVVWAVGCPQRVLDTLQLLRASTWSAAVCGGIENEWGSVGWGGRW
jgi:hypothetical protein